MSNEDATNGNGLRGSVAPDLPKELRGLDPTVWNEMWSALVPELKGQDSFLSGVNRAAASAAAKLVPGKMVALAIDRILQSEASIEALRQDIREEINGAVELFLLAEEILPVKSEAMTAENPEEWNNALRAFLTRYSPDKLLVNFFGDYILRNSASRLPVPQAEFSEWATSEEVVRGLMDRVSIEVQKAMQTVWGQTVWGSMERVASGSFNAGVFDGRFYSALTLAEDGVTIDAINPRTLRGNIGGMFNSINVTEEAFTASFVQLAQDLMGKAGRPEQAVETILMPLCATVGLHALADEWRIGDTRNNIGILTAVAKKWLEEGNAAAYEILSRIERASQPPRSARKGSNGGAMNGTKDAVRKRNW